jgi:hypothetical protein
MAVHRIGASWKNTATVSLLILSIDRNIREPARLGLTDQRTNSNPQGVDPGIASIGLIVCSWLKGTIDCARL